MKTVPPPRYAYTMFFDDVRQEIGNKLSFMGWYPTDLVVPGSPLAGVPMILPRFVICTWLVCAWGDNPEWVTVRVYGPPGKTEIAKKEMRRDHKVSPITVFDDPKRLSIFTMMPFAPFMIAEEGEISVNVETEQGEIMGGRIKVISQKNLPTTEDDNRPELQVSSKDRRKK